MVSFRDGQVVADRAVDAAPRRAGRARGSCRGRGGGVGTMSFLMILRIAFKALSRNKMRTALTMLGMIIGVAAVITMVALGTGAQTSIEAQIQSAGTNMIMVSAGNFKQGGVRMGQGNASTLTPDDAQGDRAAAGRAVRRRRRRTRAAQIVAGNQNWNTQVQGTDVDMPLIRSWPATDGAFFTPQDVTTASKVAVLGTVSATSCSAPTSTRSARSSASTTSLHRRRRDGEQGPVGHGPGSGRRDLVPYTTVMKKLRGITYIQKITVSAASAGETTRVADRIATLLRARHKIRQGDPDDFMVRTMEEMASVREEATQTMTALLASIAGVSLLVGGIGIMNIMLVSVTERTREIGLRMAIGARGRDVLLQFLVEAVVLSLVGGVDRHRAGPRPVAGRHGLDGVADDGLAKGGRRRFVFAAITGVFFGFYPARKAAALDPIEALRFE